MRALIVEDEQKIASFLKESLEAEYFAVDIAEDGECGAKLALVNEYDIIVLDYMMPKKDGLDVLREVRDSGKTTPIIIVSVQNETVNKVDLLNAGADDYLTKPFALSELLARIKALLRRPQQIAGDTLEVADIVLDNKACTVKRQGKEIHLTRKEFMLLRYLMQNTGTVLSRGMLLEHVWDMNADIFSNTIESHILSLRKKLSDTGKTRLIQTVSGRFHYVKHRTFFETALVQKLENDQ